VNIANPSQRKGLGERHTNMIAFSSVLGIGFFLQAGRVIYLAGPGLAWIAYIIMGTALWSAMASLGEMTALFPVKGAIFEFPSRFVDAAIGYACGWMSWHAKISIQIRHLDYILTDYRFAWVVVIAAEVTAVASLFRFEFDVNYLRSLNYPGTIDWTSTADISPAIFVVLWLLFILAINLLRVRIYGEIEYVIGCIKMVFLVGLIMFNIINNIRTATYFKYYQDPWGFESRNFTSSRSQSYEGGSAHLAAMWTAMTVTIFSMMGFEVVSITAPENKDLDTEESIKLATRKISLRIILLYTLGAFVVGLNVPYDDPQISDRNVSSFASGAHSVFVVAAVRDGVLGFPSFFNGFFIFSATSAGLNALYISSRLLHALANVGDVWPSWSVAQSLRRRLERTSDSGVPRAAVLTSWLFGWLAMLAVKSDTTQVSSFLMKPHVVATSQLTLSDAGPWQYGDKFHGVDLDCLHNHLRSLPTLFQKVSEICTFVFGSVQHPRGQFMLTVCSIRRAVQGREPPRLNPGQDRAAYDREDRARYPYKSHWQYVRAWYGMIACGAMAFFNGWRSISPVDGPEFVASYISVSYPSPILFRCD
jgi:amino acid permease